MNRWPRRECRRAHATGKFRPRLASPSTASAAGSTRAGTRAIVSPNMMRIVTAEAMPYFQKSGKLPGVGEFDPHVSEEDDRADGKARRERPRWRPPRAR